MEPKMKTFADLEFKPHGDGVPGHERATLVFENGHGVSVTTGPGTFTDVERPFEAMFSHDAVGDDGCGLFPRLRPDDLSELMLQAQIAAPVSPAVEWHE